MTKIIVNPSATTTQLVGNVPKIILDHYSIQCNSYEVYMPPGVIKHLRKKGHWNEFIKYHQDLPDMISNPDYAGQNPKEPNSVELYKLMSETMLIAVKMNPTQGLFLGSFYELDNWMVKIPKRLRAGRIYPLSHFKKAST